MQEQERPIPVKVFDDFIRQMVRWIEVNRPVGADRDETTRWVLSAAFSAVAVASSACASISALGGDITEEQFVGLARAAFLRARRDVPHEDAPTALA